MERKNQQYIVTLENYLQMLAFAVSIMLPHITINAGTERTYEGKSRDDGCVVAAGQLGEVNLRRGNVPI